MSQANRWQGVRRVCLAIILLAGINSLSWAHEGNKALCNAPINPPLSLRETLYPSAMVDLKAGGQVRLAGHLQSKGTAEVLLRVTSSFGVSSVTRTQAKDGAFQCRYPADFPGAAALSPCVLYIDATLDRDFNVARPGHYQAEATLILYDSTKKALPDLTCAFTNDLLDRQGRVDRQCAEWSRIRPLVNLFMRSQAARTVNIGISDFDLEQDRDLNYFKNNLTTYDFDYRDRDWSTPLGLRPRRTFWQASWNTWFNSSNNDPLDGNDANNKPSNFTPYAFSNDFTDHLILYRLYQRTLSHPLDDNLKMICTEATENLLAMQHRDASNFALKDYRGKQETYTAGAFRYGLFKDGKRYLAEKNGWFYNPACLDYIAGGVLNGRCVWGLGESLRNEPDGVLAPRLKDAIGLAVQFCLQDAIKLGYAHVTPAGNVYWRDASEHGYLLLGLLSACKVAPDLPIPASSGLPARTLREVCVSALNALVDIELPTHQYSVYSNDCLAIVALAEGVSVLGDHPDAPRWKQTAMRVADAWMDAKVDPAEYPGPAIHFGQRYAPGKMTYNLRHLSPECADRNALYLYYDGHWIQTLSRLYAVTGEERYRQRSEALVRYLCGDNPFQLRLFNELGGVYNWVEDMDGDGIEDYIKMDIYTESTLFSQVGIMHLLRAIVGVK